MKHRYDWLGLTLILTLLLLPLAPHSTSSTSDLLCVPGLPT